MIETHTLFGRSSVVGSLLSLERFFPGYSYFPLSSKTITSKFQFDQEWKTINHVLCGSASYLFDFIFNLQETGSNVWFQFMQVARNNHSGA